MSFSSGKLFPPSHPCLDCIDRATTSQLNNLISTSLPVKHIFNESVNVLINNVIFYIEIESYLKMFLILGIC